MLSKRSPLTSDMKRKATVVSKEQRKTGGGSSCAPSLTPAESVLTFVRYYIWKGQQEALAKHSKIANRLSQR